MNVWRVFTHLNNARGSNGFAVNPISYMEIDAYCRLYNEELEAWELDLLRRFDVVVLNIHTEHADAEAKKNKSKSSPR